jgi:hypothetical protein
LAAGQAKITETTLCCGQKDACNRKKGLKFDW